jgi:hypothetical protein
LLLGAIKAYQGYICFAARFIKKRKEKALALTAGGMSGAEKKSSSQSYSARPKLAQPSDI